jgi:hypothetical protein
MKPKIQTNPLHVLSLGAGVQSSTLALMAACGEIQPMPDAAIFADVGDEPASVYRWLDWLEKQLPYPVYRVNAGKRLSDDAVRIRCRKSDGQKYIRVNVPAYTLAPNGRVGFGQRKCTRDFKIYPIQRKVKALLKERGKTHCIQWIGISLDEAHRMKDSRKSYITNRWPLIENGIARRQCLDWMAVKGYPTPPRSACVFCPYHHDREWRRLKDQEPDAFAQAIEFEHRLHAALEVDQTWHGKLYLHKSLQPLESVDFRTEEERGQTDLFGNECEGMCGV